MYHVTVQFRWGHADVVAEMCCAIWLTPLFLNVPSTILVQLFWNAPYIINIL